MNMQDFYTGHAFDAYAFSVHIPISAARILRCGRRRLQHIAVETEIGTFDLHRTQSAVWECDAPSVNAGMVYQYWVRGANGQSVAHCDPLRPRHDPAPRWPQHCGRDAHGLHGRKMDAGAHKML